ncbi:MAG: DUF47 family protein [Bacteroidales bacterium]|jgi:predicted phosphate transport protein (TIGR00153 family)|nr:DUF47 family protein [Bacteroidales bacterium]MDD2687385.1 DUF47 family protein [Bacteroidales bacterium]MDD3329909.1 DUF47 family protein [Bacteroidales bacterium]MDD3691156.1 DUF47 family protein [Bacteroidales bacterium]MDD4044183.1 DUF47 family protein [Bacteroidales bacterium]
MKLNQFISILVPKENKFYPLYKKQADILVESTEHLLKFAQAQTWEEREEIYKNIKSCETKADDVTHTIFNELNKTFITPFDREDIQLLASKMDDVLDYINSAINQCVLYKPKTFTHFMSDVSNQIHQAALSLQKAFYLIPQIMKQSEKIMEACIEINAVENETDDLYRRFLIELFENEKDAIELIKRKEIMADLEAATDKAEDVTDILKSIIIKLA